MARKDYAKIPGRTSIDLLGDNGFTKPKNAAEMGMAHESPSIYNATGDDMKDGRGGDAMKGGSGNPIQGGGSGSQMRRKTRGGAPRD